MRSKFYLLSALIGAAVLLQGCFFEIVDTGHRGVKTTFGEVVGDELGEGLHTYNSFTSDIVELDVREQVLEGSTLAYTKDVQQVEVAYTINFRPELGNITTIYQDIGVDWAQRLLPQIINGKLKDVVGGYDAVNLVENRGPAMTKVLQAISEAAGKRYIQITAFEATNLDFTAEFEQATEAKVTAAQLAEKARNDTERVRFEKEQAILQAEAQAESIKIRSAALSKNPGLTAYEAVQRWDGKLPTYILGGNSIPFLNIDVKK